MGKKKNKRIEGIFRANEKGYGFIEIEGEKEDLFVPQKSVKGALNGDTVEVVIYKQKEENRRAEAKVVRIVKREKENGWLVYWKRKNERVSRKSCCLVIMVFMSVCSMKSCFFPPFVV